MVSGERITKAPISGSSRRKRPQILKLYRDEIYGRVPAGAPKVTWEVSGRDTSARGSTAVVKLVTGRMGNTPDAPRMNLTVNLPAKARGPVAGGS